MKSNVSIQDIVTLEHEGLEPYRTLRRSTEHIKQGIFVAEGEKVVRRLLASNLSIVSMLMTREWFEKIFTASDSIHKYSADIFLAEKKLVETIVGYNLHQGIMAVAKIPTERSLDETIASLAPPYFLVALDGLVNSENVGVIVRNCAAFGVQAIIVGETSSSPFLRRAVRNSMGAVFQIPVVNESNLTKALNQLSQEHTTRIVGADTGGSLRIQDANLSGSVCIVLGNEGTGISEEVRTSCNERVGIPMKNNTDSLNVANASAVFLYEASKRR